jgi:biuret amidohydrolase
MEVGIEPTVRHAIDLGFIPIVIADACGAGHAEAARRSLDSLAFEGNSIITDVASFTDVLRRQTN